MRKGAIRVTAICLASVVTLAGNSIITQAATSEVPMAGITVTLDKGVSNETESAKSVTNETPTVSSEFDSVAIAQVNDYVNIRDAASETEGQILGKLYNNSAATILGQENGWYKIKSGSVVGYVKSEYFVTGQAAEELAKEVGDRTATVNTTTLNVRLDADDDADIITLVGEDEDLSVVEEQDGWYKVQIDSDLEGYISADYVDVTTKFVEAESIEEENARKAAAEAAYLAALEEARKADAAAAAAEQQAQTEAPVTEIATGELQEVTSPEAGTSTEQTGTPETQPVETQAPVQEEQVVETQAPETQAPETQAPETQAPETQAPETEAPSTNQGLREQVVSFALQFEGNPYVWGGTSLTNGADCSGFTQSIMANFGIGIPRVADAQAAAGRQVSLDNIQPGDLLFYSDDSGYIGHVAMYIGNGQVIHASDSRSGIKISNYNYRTPSSAVSYLD